MNINELILENNTSPKMDYTAYLQKFLSYCITKKVKKGTILLKEGEINNHIYFVKKGILRFYLVHKDKEYNTWFAKENEFMMSLNSFYYNVPSNEYVQAIEDCELIITHKKVYHLIHKINHNATMQAINYVSFGLSEYQEQCIALRCMNSEERYAFLMRNKKHLMERISQKHIASFLGVEETYLSKIITKYKQTHDK